MNNSTNLDKHEIGVTGENIACKYLAEKGFRIIERNFAWPGGELDIVAEKGNMLVFAEVKTRCRTDYGLPCESIDKKKQRRIKNTALYFIKSRSISKNLNFRIDVIEVLLKDGKAFVRHIENAF